MQELETRPDSEPARLPQDAEGLPIKTLEEALRDLRERLRNYQETINQLKQRSEKATEEERLLVRLIALRRGETSPGSQEGLAALPISSVGGSNVPIGRRAVDEVVAVLDARGHPLHVSELMRVLGERKVAIPGSGTQANLISHMSRDPRIVRPARGMYGLAEWGLAEPNPGPIRKARRRRVRRTATNSKEK